VQVCIEHERIRGRQIIWAADGGRAREGGDGLFQRGCTKLAEQCNGGIIAMGSYGRKARYLIELPRAAAPLAPPPRPPSSPLPSSLPQPNDLFTSPRQPRPLDLTSALVEPTRLVQARPLTPGSTPLPLRLVQDNTPALRALHQPLTTSPACPDSSSFSTPTGWSKIKNFMGRVFDLWLGAGEERSRGQD